MAISTSSEGTAVVTGASSGIGALYADRLARRGYDLILVARNQTKLDSVAERISGTTGRSVKIIAADLAEKTDLARVEALLRTNASITMLVNNAGIGAPVPTWSADLDVMQQVIDINVSALTRLTFAATPGFAARGRGAIINIASVVALVPELLNGVYGGSKAYVLALTMSLHKELAEKGVRVQAVLPGATATDFWDLSGVPLSGVPTEITMRADDMVDAALAGYDQGELITIPSLPNSKDWAAYEAARQTLIPNLSRSQPAARYRSADAA